jgi:hypothetical protein
MSSGRIPSSAELCAFITQVSRAFEYTRQYLEAYPDGSALHRVADSRDIAIRAVSEALKSKVVAAPYGWPPHVCGALEVVTRLAMTLSPWPSTAHPHWKEFCDQFDAREQWRVFALWEEALATLNGALADEPSYAPASDEEAEKTSTSYWTLDDKAVALLTRCMKEQRPKMSKRKLAKELGCHHSSLKGCPTFLELWKVFPSEIKRSYRNAETGNIEADDSN